MKLSSLKSHSLISLVLCVPIISMTSCGSDTTKFVETPQDPGSAQSAEKPPTPPKDPILALGTKFLSALQQDDAKRFQSCWIQIPELKTFIENPPPGVKAPSSAEEFESNRDELSQRDELVRLVFPILRRALLDRCGDLSQLRFTELIVNKETETNGLKMARGFDIILSTSDNRTLKYHIDEGLFINDRWYLYDRPSHAFTIVAADGNSEVVDLIKYATDGEVAQLKKVAAALRLRRWRHVA